MGAGKVLGRGKILSRDVPTNPAIVYLILRTVFYNFVREQICIVIGFVIIRRISANLINFGVEILIRRFSQSKMRSRRGVVLSTQQCGVARGEGSLVSKWKPFRGNSSDFSGIREITK